jgi:hypothetical protein
MVSDRDRFLIAGRTISSEIKHERGFTMKNFLFAAATVLLAASGSAQATVIFQSFPDLDMRPSETSVSDLAGTSVNRVVALGTDTAFADETPALLAAYNGAASDTLEAFSINLTRGGWFGATNSSDLGAVIDRDAPIVSGSAAVVLPEPTSWLLAAGGFCALAAFSGRGAGRSRRSRLYIPEVALATAPRRAN